MNPNSTQEKCPRYLGLVEFYHPRIHGCNSPNYKKLLNHYIVFCSKNFLLNESDCEDEYSSVGEYDDPADAPYSDYETESETDSESDSDSDSETETENEVGTNTAQVSRITNYAIINEFKYLQGTRTMCINAYNSIENNSGKLLTLKAIKNFQKIIKSNHYLQPQIFEKIYINNTCCAIIKTFWIKIVQRSWKRVFKERTRIRDLRRSVRAILYWQMTNKWPNYCSYMPGLRHMIG